MQRREVQVGDGSDGVPVVGELFRYRNERSNKSELVIFLRPIIIKDASLEGDFQKFREFLPGQDFFSRPNPMKPAPLDMGRASGDSESERGGVKAQ